MSLKQAVAALDKILGNPNFAKENSKSDLPMQYACLIRPLPPILDIKNEIIPCENTQPNSENGIINNEDSIHLLKNDCCDCHEDVENSIKFVASFDIGDLEVSTFDLSCDGISEYSSLNEFISSGSTLTTDAYITVNRANPISDQNEGIELLQIKGHASEAFIPLDPKKYKTELCRSYHVHGYCKYGISRCNYAHGINQLKISFRHGKYKTRNCQSYHETGTCRYGARCSFIHDPEEGILKCPITDREILEALHYFPLERRSVANITWKVIDGSFSPSELYFFANPQSFSYTNTCKSQPYTTIIDLDLTQCCESVDAKCNLVSSLTQEAEFSPQSSADTKSNNSDEKEEPTDEFESGMGHSGTSSITEDKSEFSIEKDEMRNSQNTNNFKNIYDDRSKKDSYMKEYQCVTNNNRSFYSAENSQNYDHRGSSNKTSFSLNDFLRCLKTKEGEQHLAPWSPEPQKLCKEPEIVTKQKKCPNKIELPCRAKDMTKYKTELCRSYQYNKYCEYSDTCLYAHGRTDLRSYPKHPMYRTKKCYSFHYKGFCLYGSRCQFLHDLSF